MPIQPIFRRFYGTVWRSTFGQVLERRKYRCELCGSGGLFVKLQRSHRNHDPKDRRQSNIQVVCIGCHNRYDARHRLASRRRTLATRYGQRWLFPELEFAHLPEWAERLMRRKKAD